MEKQFSVSIAAAAATLFLTTSGAFSQSMTLRVGHGNTTESVYSRALGKFQEELKERTGGRISVKEFPGGQLGDETSTLDLYSTGDIDMNFVLSSNAVPVVGELGMLDSLFLFDGQEHFRKFATDPQTYTIVSEYIDARSLEFAPACVSLSGMRSVYTNSKEIASLADLKGLKIRVPPSPTSGQMWEALGAIPTTLPWGEIYNGLGMGVVEAAENSPSWYFDGRHIEVAKHFTDTQHQFAPAILFMGKQAREQIPADLKDAFDASLKAMCEWWLDEAFASDTGLLEKIEPSGAFLYKPSPELRQEMRATVEPLIADVVKRTSTSKLYDHINTLR